jgi:hypothetical protein
MPRKKRTSNAAGELLAKALDAVDDVHRAIVDLAGEAELEPVESGLTTDAGGDYPTAYFSVDGDEAPERGGVAFDTRLTLALDEEQAEALAFELLRAIREEGDIEIEVDGRFLLSRKAAPDLRRALRETEA